MLKIPSAEMITAISAVVVGVAALGVGMVQASIARRQSAIMEETLRASVWPVLQAEQTSDLKASGASISFSLRNAGVGPAVIYGLSLSHEGKSVPTLSHLASIAPKILTQRDAVVSSSTAAGRILAAGDELHFASAKWAFDEPPSPEDAALFKESFAALNAVRIEVCYCSAMQSCWLAASDDRKPPEPAPTCEARTYSDF